MPLVSNVFKPLSLQPHCEGEKHRIILGQVTILFMQYGIKSLTMDDIARHLGMSKKTLYQSFSDKAELVIKGIQSYMDEENKALCSIQEKSENAIEEMFLISQHVSQHLAEHAPFHSIRSGEVLPCRFQEIQRI